MRLPSYRPASRLAARLFRDLALASVLLGNIFLAGATFGATTGAAGKPAVGQRAAGPHETKTSPDALDLEISRLMHAAQVPGLAVAVIRDGKVSHIKTYGVRDVAAQMPLEPDTVMYGASLTKATFAYMVMTLVDDGAIDLDTPVADYLPKPLPDYPDYADLAGDPRWRKITPRMLLSHTSGFPNWRFYTAHGVDENGKLFIHQAPGTRYGYSGEGMQLLQFTLETGLGMDVEKLMQARVFDRFGMQRTSMTWRQDFASNATTGYDENGVASPHDQQDNFRAAGSMDTTLADYARFLEGVLGGEGLSKKSLDAMFTPQIFIHSVRQFPTQELPDTSDNDAIALSYGLGWGLFDSGLGQAFFKEGHNETTSNYVLCLRTSMTCLLLLSNSANAEGIFKYIADAALGGTCLPWYWENYVPYDHPEWRLLAAQQQPHPPCASLHEDPARSNPARTPTPGP